MKKSIHLPFVLMIAVLFFVAGPAGPLYAEEEDLDTAAVICEECETGPEAPAVACTLSVPASLTNGDVFTAQISYSPSVVPPFKEKFIFKWPSRCDYFAEKTVRIKNFKSGTSAVSASLESVVVPTALCIEGTFTAKVKVKGICSATATMTITNP